MRFLFEGIELDVDFYYSPAEVETWTDPGWPEECFVEAVRVNGVDISPLISEEIAERMADKYLADKKGERYE